MKMITGRCDICNGEIRPADNQGQFNRNLGWHKLKAHGVKGTAATTEGKRASARARHWRLKGYTEAQIAEKQKEFATRQGSNGYVPTPHAHSSAAPQPQMIVQPRNYGKPLPVAVSECPCCFARFYVTRPR